MPRKRSWRPPRNRKIYRKKHRRAASVIGRAFRRHRNKRRIGRVIRSRAVYRFNPSGTKIHYQTFTRTGDSQMFQNPYKPDSITGTTSDQLTTGCFGVGPQPSTGLTGQYTTIQENLQAGLLIRNYVTSPSAPYAAKVFNAELTAACRRYRQVKIISANFVLQPYRNQMNDQNDPLFVPAVPQTAFQFPGSKCDWVTQLMTMLNYGQWDDPDPLVKKSAKDIQSTNISLADLEGFTNMDQFLIADKGLLKQISSNQHKSYKFTSKPPKNSSSWSSQRYQLWDNAAVPVNYSTQRVNTWLNTADILSVANGNVSAAAEAQGQIDSLFAIGTLPVLNIQASGLPLRRGYPNGVLRGPLSYPLFRLIVSIKCAFRQEAAI